MSNEPETELSRWIFASVSKHFADNLALPLYIEGQFKTVQEEKHFAELRIIGPDYRFLSSNCWVVEIEIDILLQSVMNDKEYHTIWQNMGLAKTALQPCIPVLRYGCEDNDDLTFYGNLIRYAPRRAGEEIRSNMAGQVEPDINLQQATVSASYRMEFQPQ